MKCSFYLELSIIKAPAAEIQNEIRDFFFLAFKRKGKGKENLPFPAGANLFPHACTVCPGWKKSVRSSSTPYTSKLYFANASNESVSASSRVLFAVTVIPSK